MEAQKPKIALYVQRSFCLLYTSHCLQHSMVRTEGGYCIVGITESRGEGYSIRPHIARFPFSECCEGTG